MIIISTNFYISFAENGSVLTIYFPSKKPLDCLIFRIQKTAGYSLTTNKIFIALNKELKISVKFSFERPTFTSTWCSVIHLHM